MSSAKAQLAALIAGKSSSTPVKPTPAPVVYIGTVLTVPGDGTLTATVNGATVNAYTQTHVPAAPGDLATIQIYNNQAICLGIIGPYTGGGGGGSGNYYNVTPSLDMTGATDTAAINAAIAGGQGVRLAPGNFYVDADITVSGFIDFFGAGGGRVSVAGTTIILVNSTAVMSFTGGGRVEGFVVDGNNTATNCIIRQNGSYGTFVDVYAQAAAQDNWLFLAAQNDSYYSCGSFGAARDACVFDQGTGGHDFFHFNEAASNRYSINIQNPTVGGGGSYGASTESIHFYGGILDSVGGSPTQTNKIILANAIDIAFINMNIVGLTLSSHTVTMDASTCFGIDLTGSVISGTAVGGSPGNALVEIHGAPPNTGAHFFGTLKTDGVYFINGDTSVYVNTSGSVVPTISAVGWKADGSNNGPVTGASCPASANSILGLGGRGTAFQVATLASGWTGALIYRITTNGMVEIDIAALGTTSGSTVTTLPPGFRPSGTIVLPAVPDSGGVAFLSITSAGVVTCTAITGTVALVEAAGLFFAPT